MNIECKRVGTVEVVAPKGPLVDEDAERFVALMKDKLTAPNPRLVLDMKEVAYMDSRGIEGLVEAADDLQHRGGRLRLAALTATCREVLELTGQTGRLEFFDETQSAVRSFL